MNSLENTHLLLLHPEHITTVQETILKHSPDLDKSTHITLTREEFVAMWAASMAGLEAVEVLASSVLQGMCEKKPTQNFKCN